MKNEKEEVVYFANNDPAYLALRHLAAVLSGDREAILAIEEEMERREKDLLPHEGTVQPADDES